VGEEKEEMETEMKTGKWAETKEVSCLQVSVSSFCLSYAWDVTSLLMERDENENK
jgi:hypothetical protein